MSDIESILNDAVAQGANADQVRQIYARLQGTDLGTGHGIAAGLAQGGTFGLGDEAIAATAAARSAFDKGKLSDFSKDYGEALDIERGAEKRFSEDHPVLSIGSNIAGGLATGIAGGTTNAGKTLAANLAKGGLGARVAKGVAVGAASGGAYGFGTGEGSLENRAKSAGIGAATGGAIGGAIPLAGAGLKKTAEVVVPKIDEATAELAKRAEDFGIPLRLDQISPTRARKTVQKASQAIPFSGTDKFESTQKTAWNSALAKTIGQDADDLGPSVINAFRADNSQKFDNAFKGVSLNVGQNVKKEISDIVLDAKKSLDAGLAKVVEQNADDTIEQLNKGFISGDKFTSIRSELLRHSVRARNAASSYIGDIIDKLDDMASSQIPAPQQSILSEARREWRNFKTIQPLLEKSTDGSVNPTDLMNRVAQSKYINAARTPTGKDELIDLARIGKQLLPKAGGSDTFDKSIMTGSVIGSFLNPKVAAGAAATVGGNRAYQSLVNRNPALVKKAIENALSAVPSYSNYPQIQPAANSARDSIIRFMMGA